MARPKVLPRRDELHFLGDNGYVELALVGHPSDFYAYDVKKPGLGSSGRVTSSAGSQAYWQRARKILKSKDKQAFQILVDEIHERFPHD